MEEVIAKALAIIALVATLLLLKASVVAFSIGCIYARPALCERIYHAYTQRPRRATLIGTVNSLVLLFIVLLLLNVEVLGVLGILIFAGLCTAHLAGRTARYRELASQISGDSGTVPALPEMLRAGVLVELAFLVPLVGQLTYLIVSMRCAGAFFMALLGRTPSPLEDSGAPVDSR